MKRLIINADDFAISPAVTSGILEAHAAGTVTSSSMMVQCPGWQHGLGQARATPSLGIGLHLNLLVGAPLAAVPSLTAGASGRFHSLPALAWRALAGALDRDEITAECEAQLGAIRDAGIPVTHIDSHRHVHAMPRIRGAVAAVAARHGLPLRRPVESAPGVPAGPRVRMHRALVAWSWRLASAGTAATRAPDHFAGIALQGGAWFAERLGLLLDALPDGTTELMVHPGRVDDALRSVDAYTSPREVELAALTSPALGQRLRRGDLSCIGFRAL